MGGDCLAAVLFSARLVTQPCFQFCFPSSFFSLLNESFSFVFRLKIQPFLIFTTMKLTSRVLALAAVVATALLGTASAGVVDGPCTITADMSMLTGTCPTGLSACLTPVSLAPDSADGTTITLPASTNCTQAGYSTLDSSTRASVTAFISQSSYGVRVSGFGSGVNTSIVTTVGTPIAVCQVQATITSGSCLYGGSSASSSNAVTGAASAVAAAAVAAGAALLL